MLNAHFKTREHDLALTCERSVHGGEEAVGVSGARDDARLVEEQRAEPGGRRPQRRVDDRRRDGDPVTRVRDAALFTRYDDCFKASGLMSSRDSP